MIPTAGCKMLVDITVGKVIVKDVIVFRASDVVNRVDYPVVILLFMGLPILFIALNTVYTQRKTTNKYPLEVGFMSEFILIY